MSGLNSSGWKNPEWPEFGLVVPARVRTIFADVMVNQCRIATMGSYLLLYFQRIDFFSVVTFFDDHRVSGRCACVLQRLSSRDLRSLRRRRPLRDIIFFSQRDHDKIQSCFVPFVLVIVRNN